MACSLSSSSDGTINHELHELRKGLMQTALSSIKLLGLVLSSLLFASCAGRLHTGSGMTVAPGWITVGSDFARSSYRNDVHLTPPLKEIWKVQFMAGVAESPLFFGDVAIVPLLNGEVSSLSLSEGKRLGRKKFPGGAIIGTALDDGQLFLTLGPERASLRSYDLTRGRAQWKTPIQGAAGSPVITGERVIMTGLHGSVTCLNVNDGSLIWEVDERSALHASAALDSHLVVYQDRNGTVICRNIRTGNLVWKSALDDHRPYSNPVICNRRVFVTSLTGKVHAFSLREGTPLWVWDQEDPIYASVSCDSSAVYVPSSSGMIAQLSQDTGRLGWLFDARQFINQEVAVSVDHVVSVTARGDVILLSRESGKEVWRTRVEGRTIGPPVIHNGRVLVADDKKWLTAFE